MFTRVVRLPEASDVSKAVASRLLEQIIELQRSRDTVHICLTGGNAANALYEEFARLAEGSELDASRLQLWWSDERFVPATDPERNSQQAISRLARTVPIQDADTHLMAAKDGRKDSHESAAEYEAELGDTSFDIALLGIGEDGHVASIFPAHPSFEATNRAVIGVEDSPKAPAERISLTLPTLNRADELWMLATGRSKADAVQRSISGDESVPGAHVQGRVATYWFLDDGAAENLPVQYTCTV